MKKAFWIILSLAVLFYSSGIGADTPMQGGQLIVSQPAEPPGLDPTGNTAAAIDRVV